MHATHILKLLDKMCKYEMDQASIVADTEWTRFCPLKPVYPHFTLLKRGV